MHLKHLSPSSGDGEITAPGEGEPTENNNV